MVEFDHFAHFYKMSDEEVIQKLIAAGLDSCPGGGAGIFREPTRSMICAHKCDAARWLELQEKVHAAGLKTNATMLWHIESIEDRVDHLVRLREHAGKIGRFQCFIRSRSIRLTRSWPTCRDRQESIHSRRWPSRV